MQRRTFLRLVTGLGAIGVVVLLLASCSAVRAGRVLRDALDPGLDLASRVEETEWTVAARAGPTRVRLLRPVGVQGPLPAFVVVHGAVDVGADEPRLTALARSISSRGATVGAIDLPALRSFRLDARDPGRIADVAAALAARTEIAADGRVALIGISVGGSYCLVAARDPALRERVPAVLGFGAYDDLNGLLSTWMTDPVDAPGMFDPWREGRHLVFLGNVERLVDTRDVPWTRHALQALLRGEAAPRRPDDLGERARRLIDVAESEAAVPPATAEALLAPLEDDLARLSPLPTDDPPRGLHVYLLHGDGDPVVPTSAAHALGAGLEAAGADTRVHVTDVFGHVDAGEQPSLWQAWPLLRFLGAFLSDSGM